MVKTAPSEPGAARKPALDVDERQISSVSLGLYRLIDEYDVPVREVRFAATMVGGSSLAVYESGVGIEIFRMIHGQGLYALLKRLTQSHAYVDIMSGTSAGGINTLALATSIANGTDFRLMRDIWIELAGIDPLMQDPTNTKAISLLRGNDYYYPRLVRAFGSLVDQNRPVNWSVPGIPSGEPGGKRCTDLDLMITGTYFEGLWKVFFDSRTKPIYTCDYGGVFCLKHRTGREESHFDYTLGEPLTPVTQPRDNVPWPGAPRDSVRRQEGIRDRLARIARTTSSLPAVFEPSQVDRDLMNQVIELPTNRDFTFLLDGGFLNNQPIDLVLKEINDRPASQQVARKVLFVVPDPEQYRAQDEKEPLPPTALENLWFYKDVPGRQTISRYLQGLFEHNRKVQKIDEILETARNLTATYLKVADSSTAEETGSVSSKISSDRCQLDALESDGRSISPDGADPCAPLRDSQHNQWVEINLLTLRDRLIELWEEALGLENYAGVERADDVSPSQEVQRKKQANALRHIRDCLYERFRCYCGDYRSSAGVGDGKNASARTLFHLYDIDANTTGRLAMRAVGEIYNVVYHPPAYSSGVSQEARESPAGETQANVGRAGRSETGGRRPRSLKQQLYLTVRDRGDAHPSPEEGRGAWYERYRDGLGELYHLRDLAATAWNEVEEVAKAVAGSREFKSALEEAMRAAEGHASREALESAIENLWKCLFCYLYWLLLSCDQLSVEPISLYRGGGDEAATDRERQRESKEVREILVSRTQQICALLREQEEGPDGQPVNEDLRAQREEIKQWIDGCRARMDGSQTAVPADSLQTLPPEPTTILMGIRMRLYSHVCEMVEHLEGAIERHEELLEAIHAERSERYQNCSYSAVPPAPLAWALRPRDAFGTRRQKGAQEIGQGLELLDEFLYPVEVAAGLVNRRPVDLVYVSPRDIQIGFSRRPMQDKLSGDVLSHLGGFLKSSWRANDILWGRLDGSGAIAETLLDEERLARILDAYEGRDSDVGSRMLRAIEGYILRGDLLAGSAAAGDPDGAGEPDDIGKLLRGRYEEMKAELERWFRVGYRSALDDPAEAPVLADLRDLLVRRHQLEILQEEVPDVVAEAIAEHALWQGSGLAVPEQLGTRVRRDRARRGLGATTELLRRIRTNTDLLADQGGYQPDDTNRNVIRAQARRISRGLFSKSPPGLVAPSSPTPPPDAEAIRDYFNDRYDVGAETPLRDIPPMVTLQRIVSLALIALHVLGNSLTPEFRGSGIGKLLDRFVIGPLALLAGTLYGFITVIVQGKTAQAVAHAIVWTIIVLAGIGYFLHKITLLSPLVAVALILFVIEVAMAAWLPGGRSLGRPIGIIGSVGIAYVLVSYGNRGVYPFLDRYALQIWWVSCFLLLLSCLLSFIARVKRPDERQR